MWQMATDLPEFCKIPGLKEFQRTGSNYICDPPVVNTDIDYICLVADMDVALLFCHKQGWKDCGKEYEGSSFYACRNGTDNYILTADDLYYLRFCAATELARVRNLTDKADRIALFHKILGEEQGASDSGFELDELEF